MSKVLHENRTPLIGTGRRLTPTAHLHGAVELVYLKQGTTVACCNNKKYNLKAGSFFCAFPNQVHYYKDPEDKANLHYCVIFEPEQVPAFSDIFLKKMPECPVCVPNDPILEQLFGILASESPKDLRGQFALGLLTAVISRLLPNFKLIKASTPSDHTTSIIQFCNDHFSEEISCERLCRELYISRGTISSIFKKTLNTTFNDYINTLRLEKTVSLVLREGLSFSSAAAVAGFASTRTFNRAFLKKYGQTPREYLKPKKRP